MAHFVHLHVHSEFSLLDGLSRVTDLARRASELDMPAIALTDHGAMYGIVNFCRACVSRGINPIVGLETYVAPRRMTDRDPQKDKNPFHLVLLAENQTGYQNLLRIATASQLEGFYYKPRVDKPFLAEHTEGIIALSACSSGELAYHILNDDMEQARQVALWYRDTFGPDNFFIEIQKHEGIPETDKLNQGLVALARKLGIGLVATNDLHYVRAEDAEAQDILLCIQTGKVKADPDRMRMADESFYLKSADEMAALFAEWPDALENTVRIAERCHVDVETQGYHLPLFTVPDGYNTESYLRELAESGFRKRYPQAGEAEWQRLNYELGVIHEMGFDTYFLILWDLCRYAIQKDIWWNVRGSGAGSVVAYSLGITRLDPLPHNLLFERFLNPERVTMPDVDLDYPDDRRQEMIEYTRAKYGADKVANIITFGTLGARAAVRDVGRALDIPLNEVDRVAKLVPTGPKVHLKDAFENPEFKQVYEAEGYIREWVDMAFKVEGIARHASVHAAGVVITDKPLVEYIPLARAPKGDSDMAVTQFPMTVIESIGLLKLDFLGLATLSQMRKAAELIEQRHDTRLDLDTIPTGDPCIFQVLTNGEVAGVFQVESGGMKKTLAQMRPTCLDDITAVVSLYRPGPMQFIDTYCRRKHGEEGVEFIHPALEPILQETYGVIVYQEQIIRIMRDLAGYSGGQADVIRRAISKKYDKLIAEHKVKFRQGCEANGIPGNKADEIYASIEFFANYGFNKAHAADYAVITCQTAYLKAKYPVEYMTALLTVEQNNTEKVSVFLAECRRLGIPVLPPDVNTSYVDFTVEEAPADVLAGLPRAESACALTNGAIRFGLGGIKNVSAVAVQQIIQARQEGGGFATLADFCERVDLRQINRRMLECLIKVGALDQYGSRAQLLAAMDQMMSVSAKVHQAQDVGQLTMFDLFGGDGPSAPSAIALPEAEPVSAREMLNWEKELVGFYVSEHPLNQVAVNLRDTVTCFCGEISEEMNGQNVVVAGVIDWVRPHYTKRGDPMVFAHLEDIQGGIEVVVFPRTYAATQDLWKQDKILVVHGRVDAERGEPKIICESAQDYLVTVRIIEEHAPAYLPPDAAPSGGEAAPAGREAPGRADPAPPVPVRGNGDGEKGANRIQEERVVLVESGPSHHVEITIRRTGDHMRDQQRTARVYDILQRHEGHDHFTFYLVGNRHRVQIDFPNVTTSLTPDLTRLLSDMLGQDAIRFVS